MRRHPERLPRALEILRGHGWTVHERPTTGPAMAGTLAATAIADGADLIVVAGGDGTINEVVGGMAGSTVPLAVLPGGTANVLCCELGLPSSMEKVARQLPGFAAKRIPLGLHTSARGARHFALMAGIGLDAHIVEHLPAGLKRRLGKVAYWIEGFRSVLRRLPEFAVQVDGRAYRASFALVTRVRNYGGDLEIARRVRLTDDDFEIILFAGSLAPVYLKYFAGVALNQLPRLNGVHVLRGRTVEVSDPDAAVFVQLDGEAAGPIPSRIEILPGALTLLMPASYG